MSKSLLPHTKNKQILLLLLYTIIINLSSTGNMQGNQDGQHRYTNANTNLDQKPNSDHNPNLNPIHSIIAHTLDTSFY